MLLIVRLNFDQPHNTPYSVILAAQAPSVNVHSGKACKEHIETIGASGVLGKPRGRFTRQPTGSADLLARRADIW